MVKHAKIQWSTIQADVIRIIEFAEQRYPQTNPWTLEIMAWEDEDYQIHYFHNGPLLQYRLTLKGTDKELVCFESESKIIRTEMKR